MRTPQSRLPPLNRSTPLLGGLSPVRFMREYWQKKPLLIRQALAVPDLPLTRDEVFALAARDDIECRVISRRANRWRVQQGPFDARDLPSTAARDWTLLVQGVDLYHDAAAALLERFRFIPDARLDDLMVSYATDRGGVGAHVDSYDVFLLQLHGRRRWRISTQRDLTLRDDVPLKLLRHFAPEEEWLLEPGDMLYLPPHVAHDGVAEGECMTASIGFRAPRADEIAGQFFFDLAERSADQAALTALRYRDPGRQATATPAALPDDMIDTVADWLGRVRWSRQDVAGFLGRYLSEPKQHVVFDAPARCVGLPTFVKRLHERGMRLDARTRLLYVRGKFFINGEPFTVPAGARALVRRLADRRALYGGDFVTLSHESPIAALLHEWYLAGWAQLGLMLKV